MSQEQQPDKPWAVFNDLITRNTCNFLLDIFVRIFTITASHVTIGSHYKAMIF